MRLGREVGDSAGRKRPQRCQRWQGSDDMTGWSGAGSQLPLHTRNLTKDRDRLALQFEESHQLKADATPITKRGPALTEADAEEKGLKLRDGSALGSANRSQSGVSITKG